MKHRSLYIIGLMASLALSGCQDFLSVEQKGKSTIPVFLSYPEGLHAGLVGAYNKTYAYLGNQITKYGDVAGNMLSMRYTAGATDMLPQYNYVSEATEETGAVGYIWRNAYEAMANANNVIQYQPQVLADYPQDAAFLRQILGQAYALRALCHFDICRAYSQPYCFTPDGSHLGIPVLTKTPGPNDNPARNTVAEVYAQILSDLSQAESLLEEYSLSDKIADSYHFNREAVQAFKARVYLYMQRWQDAYDYASSVADRMPLARGDEYLDMYRTFTTQGESLFRLCGDEQSGKLKAFYDQTALPADTLLGLFEPRDIRLNLLYLQGQKYVAKYYVPNTEDAKRDDPFVIRTSEVYLTAAEAACELGRYADARRYLSPILSRAVDEAYASTVLSATGDGQPLLALVLKERVKELCFEGHCLFDLTRRGADLVRESNTNSTLKRLDWPSSRFVLPIPETELNANHNVKGNPDIN